MCAFAAQGRRRSERERAEVQALQSEMRRQVEALQAQLDRVSLQRRRWCRQLLATFHP